jgi:hypothetical protein
MAVQYLEDEELLPPLDDESQSYQKQPMFRLPQPFRLSATSGPQLVPQQQAAPYGGPIPDQFDGYLGPETEQGYVAAEYQPEVPVAPMATPVAPDVTISQDKLFKALEDRPQRTKPKWWQSLGAAALGGAAGWSNAAGRTRKPIEVDESVDEILNPGYARKLTDWTSRVKQLQGQSEIEGKQNAAARQGRQDVAANSLHQAQMDHYKALAEMERGQGRNGSVPVTKAIEEMTGGIFKVGQQISSSTATELARIQAGKFNVEDKTFVVTDPDVAKRLGVKLNAAVPIELYKEAVRYHRTTPLDAYLNANEGDWQAAIDAYQKDELAKRRTGPPRATPAGRQPARTTATPATFKQIEDKKGDSIRRASEAYKKDLTTANSDEQRATAHKNYIDANDAAQRVYRASIRAAGGSADEPGGGSGTSVDPKFKAYADKYFGGDVARAKAYDQSKRDK